jgi:hypothetical protein
MYLRGGGEHTPAEISAAIRRNLDKVSQALSTLSAEVSPRVRCRLVRTETGEVQALWSSTG